MGAPIKYAFPDLGILILFLLLFLLVSFFTLRYRINLLKERTA
jgi:hypothetical protein